MFGSVQVGGEWVRKLDLGFTNPRGKVEYVFVFWLFFVPDRSVVKSVMVPVVEVA